MTLDLRASESEETDDKSQSSTVSWGTAAAAAAAARDNGDAALSQTTPRTIVAGGDTGESQSDYQDRAGRKDDSPSTISPTLSAIRASENSRVNKNGDGDLLTGRSPEESMVQTNGSAETTVDRAIASLPPAEKDGPSSGGASGVNHGTLGEVSTHSRLSADATVPTRTGTTVERTSSASLPTSAPIGKATATRSSTYRNSAVEGYASVGIGSVPSNKQLPNEFPTRGKFTSTTTTPSSEDGILNYATKRDAVPKIIWTNFWTATTAASSGQQLERASTARGMADSSSSANFNSPGARPATTPRRNIATGSGTTTNTTEEDSHGTEKSNHEAPAPAPTPAPTVVQPSYYKGPVGDTCTGQNCGYGRLATASLAETPPFGHSGQTPDSTNVQQSVTRSSDDDLRVDAADEDIINEVPDVGGNQEGGSGEVFGSADQTEYDDTGRAEILETGTSPTNPSAKSNSTHEKSKSTYEKSESTDEKSKRTPEKSKSTNEGGDDEDFLLLITVPAVVGLVSFACLSCCFFCWILPWVKSRKGKSGVRVTPVGSKSRMAHVGSKCPDPVNCAFFDVGHSLVGDYYSKMRMRALFNGEAFGGEPDGKTEDASFDGRSSQLKAADKTLEVNEDNDGNENYGGEINRSTFSGKDVCKVPSAWKDNLNSVARANTKKGSALKDKMTSNPAEEPLSKRDRTEEMMPKPAASHGLISHGLTSKERRKTSYKTEHPRRHTVAGTLAGGCGLKSKVTPAVDEQAAKEKVAQGYNDVIVHLPHSFSQRTKLHQY